MNPLSFTAQKWQAQHFSAAPGFLPLKALLSNNTSQKPSCFEEYHLLGCDAVRLHGVTSQKMILFITTAVKTSNPTLLFFLIIYSSELEVTHLVLGANLQ
jgi:hypothetical protein